jgi:hypothetical protein
MGLTAIDKIPQQKNRRSGNPTYSTTVPGQRYLIAPDNDLVPVDLTLQRSITPTSIGTRQAGIVIKRAR